METSETGKIYYFRKNSYHRVQNNEFIHYLRKNMTRKHFRKLLEVGNKIYDNKQSSITIDEILLTIRVNLLTYLHREPCEPMEDSTSVFYFITINPPPKIESFKQLKKIIDDYLRSKYIRRYQYCLEQRSSILNKPYGYHIHLILEKTVKPSKVKTDLCRVFNKYHVRLPKFNMKTFQKYDDPDILKDKMDYLKVKGSPEKDKKKEVDKALCRKLGIPDYVDSWTNLSVKSNQQSDGKQGK